MSTTLGGTVNVGLRTIGEPEVTAFTSTNILQQELIKAANEGVHDILEAARYRWGLFYDGLTTADAITTEQVAVTADSTTVTSVDDDDAGAMNFGSVVAGDWLRVSGDMTSYRVASVDSVSDPNTLVLEDAYVGATSTGSAYKIVRDIFAISTSSLDEVIIAAYGDNSASYPTSRILNVDLRRIFSISGGDLHSDTSGKPRYMAQIGSDSSGNPQFRLWPYPDDQYLIELWYTLKFTSNTTFATSMFGANAPDIAYDAVDHYVRWRACMYDNDPRQADTWYQKYMDARNKVVAREARTYRDGHGVNVVTYRRDRGSVNGFRTESQIAFDTVGVGGYGRAR